jgi:hypothetical protein
MPEPDGSAAEYSDRYCAFVDILGFRQLVESLSKDPQNVRTLRALLQKVHGGGTTKKLVRAQSISDAVLRILMGLAIDLLCEGFFIRGAVVRGPRPADILLSQHASI